MGRVAHKDWEVMGGRRAKAFIDDPSGRAEVHIYLLSVVAPSPMLTHRILRGRQSCKYDLPKKVIADHETQGQQTVPFPAMTK